jgi:hypothetical protein
LFDGQITEDFCLCIYLNTSQCLMDNSMEICVFAVTWTKDSVWWTSHRRFLSLQLLEHKAVFVGHITGDLCLWSYLDKSQCLMDKSMEICVFTVTWTKVSVWWTSPWRFVSLQLLGHKAVFDGHVTGDLCFWSYLDKSQCLMDTSMEICVFAVTWTKDSVWWTSHRRFLSLQLLGRKAVCRTHHWRFTSLKLLGQKSVFDGQVHGDLCLCSYLDVRQCLKDTSLGIYFFKVTWT